MGYEMQEEASPRARLIHSRITGREKIWGTASESVEEITLTHILLDQRYPERREGQPRHQ
jgi:hypothetical protein